MANLEKYTILSIYFFCIEIVFSFFFVQSYLELVENEFMRVPTRSDGINCTVDFLPQPETH